MTCWAYLKPESPFYSLFPEGRVIIRSIVPMIPREVGCPPCYVLKAESLSDRQIQELAWRVYDMWQPECESIDQAIEYVRQGLPLKTSWFNGCSTDDYFYVKTGAALNCAIHLAYAHYIEDRA